jgi:hypothetical protein
MPGLAHPHSHAYLQIEALDLVDSTGKVTPVALEPAPLKGWFFLSGQLSIGSLGKASLSITGRKD